jgi:oligopeptide transport system ATP-binding protein
MSLLSVQGLQTFFHTRNGIVRAVDDVSFDVEAGQTVGIVGESGSGKSVSCYSLLGLIPKPPGKIAGGKAMFGEVDLLQASEKVMRGIRGRRIGMIFQDPMTCLNPFLTVETQLCEPLEIHFGTKRKEARTKAIEALEEVGIQDAEKRLKMYPHEFSGGMRQRVMIAMALITRPEILIADEPTTALDVTVQAQILELIRRRQEELGTAIIFITHDLGVVAGFCDFVNVMYGGKIVESAPTREIFYQSQHPYTRALRASIPSLQSTGEDLYTIPGMPPDLSRLPAGCAFAARCAHATDICRGDTPALLEVAANHRSACVRYQKGELKV